MSNNSIVNSFMNDLFDEESMRYVLSPVSSSRLGSSPALNIKELNEKFEIILKAPGIDPSKIDLEIEDKMLTISYDEADSGSKEEGKYIRREWSHHYSFSRSLMLSKGVDSKSIGAEYEKGILKITVNKLPEVQPKKIDIQIKGS